MNTLTHETPQQTAPRRPRRTWLIILIAVLAIAGLAVGTWLIIDANQTDDLAVATEFADTGDLAWTTGDGDALAALFTEDGIWKGPSGTPIEGRDAISKEVRDVGYFSEMSHGEVTEVEEGVFTFPFRGVWLGATYEGETRITLEGDLVSYAEVVKWQRVYE